MKNEYEVRGEVVAIFIDSPKYGRMETLISANKLQRADEFPKTWCAAIKNDSFFVTGTVNDNGKRHSISLHRWITDAPDGMAVDHINHDILNNTDKNLRVVTNAQNLQNRKGATINSKSGVRGVCWIEVRKKWRVRMKLNDTFTHIGYFENINDAEQAAIKTRTEYMPYSQEALAN